MSQSQDQNEQHHPNTVSRAETQVFGGKSQPLDSEEVRELLKKCRGRPGRTDEALDENNADPTDHESA